MTLRDYNGPEAFRPITPWGYVGYMLLFSIPIVGLIFLIVYSFSDKNLNRRSFARSYWCVLLIAVLLGLIFLVPALNAYESFMISSFVS